MNFHKEQKGFSLVTALLIFVVMALVGTVACYIWQIHQKTTKPVIAASRSADNLTGHASQPARNTEKNTDSQSTPAFVLPSGWSWDSTSYGFKVAYPNDWGTPRATTASNGIDGTTYDTEWFASGEYVINVDMDSNNYIFQGCNDSGSCSDVPTSETKAAYSQTLASINRNSYSLSDYTIIAHSDTSYMTLLTNIGTGATDLLDDYRMVSIPVLNVSATYGEYELLGASNACLQNQLSPANTQPCLSQSTADEFSEVIGSVQAL
jgi:hypothetical protein